MTELLKNIFKPIETLVKTIGLNKSAKQLELLSDKQLDDLGVSREKLKLGAAAYPWKAEADTVIQVGHFTRYATSKTLGEDQQAA